jgi:hypothetical protein
MAFRRETLYNYGNTLLNGHWDHSCVDCAWTTIGRNRRREAATTIEQLRAP